MNQLSLIPVCENHGVEKVWINDRSNRNGGFYRCRECNRLDSLRRNAKNRANPEKVAELNEGQRRRYNAQPQEDKDARNQQIVKQRRERLRADPVAKEIYRLANNAHNSAWRSKKPERDHRDSNLRKCYGIGVADYERMYEEQGGKCKICGSTTSRSKRTRHFFVDHCHETGAVRGLLCGPCNSGLGSLGDNVGTLEKAIAYLNAATVGTAARAA